MFLCEPTNISKPNLTFKLSLPAFFSQRLEKRLMTSFECYPQTPLIICPRTIHLKGRYPVCVCVCMYTVCVRGRHSAAACIECVTCDTLRSSVCFCDCISEVSLCPFHTDHLQRKDRALDMGSWVALSWTVPQATCPGQHSRQFLQIMFLVPQLCHSESWASDTSVPAAC